MALAAPLTISGGGRAHTEKVASRRRRKQVPSRARASGFIDFCLTIEPYRGHGRGSRGSGGEGKKQSSYLQCLP